MKGKQVRTWFRRIRYKGRHTQKATERQYGIELLSDLQLAPCGFLV